MACPHLSYRRESEDRSFERERAYCTVADRFVQPMRADICTERYGLDPASDCEIYRADAGLAWDESSGDGAESAEAADGSGGAGDDSPVEVNESTDGENESEDRTTESTDGENESEDRTTESTDGENESEDRTTESADGAADSRGDRDDE